MGFAHGAPLPPAPAATVSSGPPGNGGRSSHPAGRATAIAPAWLVATPPQRAPLDALAGEAGAAGDGHPGERAFEERRRGGVVGDQAGAAEAGHGLERARDVLHVVEDFARGHDVEARAVVPPRLRVE